MKETQPATTTREEPSVLETPVPEPTCAVQLSERDAADILAMADNPPTPNEAALRAARRYMQQYEPESN